MNRSPARSGISHESERCGLSRHAADEHDAPLGLARHRYDAGPAAQRSGAFKSARVSGSPLSASTVGVIRPPCRRSERGQTTNVRSSCGDRNCQDAAIHSHIDDGAPCDVTELPALLTAKTRAPIMEEKRRCRELLDDCVWIPFLPQTAHSGLAVSMRAAHEFRNIGVNIVDPWAGG